MTNRMKFLENLKMKKLRKGQKGFTLIELLVVIAILGVIAAVAVPNILGFMDEGDQAAIDAEQHNVQVAVTAYMYEDGTLPATGQTGTISFNADYPTEGTPTVGDYLVGGNESLQYVWTINEDGSVEQDTSG